MHFYGISTCDTCRKAQKWLKAQEVQFEFIDLKQDPVPTEVLDRLIRAHLKDEIKAVNKSSMAWRDLSDDQKQAINTKDQKALYDAFTNTPLLIKRPLIDHKGALSCGFTEAIQQRLLSH